jgi:hypothetical protein
VVRYRLHCGWNRQTYNLLNGAVAPLVRRRLYCGYVQLAQLLRQDIQSFRWFATGSIAGVV